MNALVLAGILAVIVPIAAHVNRPGANMRPSMRGRRPVSCWHGMAAARAGKRGQSLTIQQPVTFANGMADGCRLTGGRAVSLTDGVRMAGRVSLLTGSRFLGARSLIIPFRTGAARRRVG